MNKRYVSVHIKSTGHIRVFPTITKMFSTLGEENIGVTRNSLWNALSAHGGKYENDKVKVEYKERKAQVWR